MGLAQVAVFGAAVMTLLGLPCAVVVLRVADETALRRRAWKHRPAPETQALRELDRAMQERDAFPVLNEAVLNEAVLDDAPAPAIEEQAQELRRLDRQRRGGPTLESERWLAAVQRAYDDRLCLACHCLGVPEHLTPLDGLDREIERVRVEGALQAAGVALRA